MPRKPTDLVNPSLRIREDLRRRLEAAAKKRGVSLNQEMVDRLKASFDQAEVVNLGKVADDLQKLVTALAPHVLVKGDDK
jgi:ribosomal protein L18E